MCTEKNVRATGGTVYTWSLMGEVVVLTSGHSKGGVEQDMTVVWFFLCKSNRPRFEAFFCWDTVGLEFLGTGDLFTEMTTPF